MPLNVLINSYVVAPASIVVNSNTNSYTFSGTGTISGATSLIKNGSSNLTISNNNDYTGGTTINAGTVTVTSPQPFVGNVALNNGAALAVYQSTLDTTYGWGTLATVNVAAGNTGTISMIQQNGDSTFTTGTTLSMFTSGTLTGGGTVNYVTSNLTPNGTLSTEVDVNSNAGAFTGTINFVNVAPRTTIRVAGAFGSSSAFYNLGTTGVLATNGATTVNMGALTGGPGTILKGFEGINGSRRQRRRRGHLSGRLAQP